MLNAIIRFALRYRVLIVFLSLAVLVYGSYTAATLPIDVFPDLDRPRVIILTECPGYAPEDVESQVTFPLESALNGATGVEAVRSQSGPSLSVVFIDFGWDTDIYVARQIVQERLNTVRLPPGITPQMTPISSIMGQVLVLGMRRLPGPHGGALAPVGDTGLLAELLLDPSRGRATLHLLDPRADNGARLPDPADWRPVQSASTSVPLTWTPPAARGLHTQARPQEQTVTLAALPGQSGSFSAQDALLEKVADPAEVEWHAAVSAAGKTHKVTFPTFLQSQLDLRTLADWVVRLRLLKVSGVAQVVSMGGGRKQYQVLADPEALTRHRVSLDEVTEALRRNNLNTSGGWLQRGDREQPVRFLGRLGPGDQRVLDELRQVPVKETAERNVLLGEVARVVEGPELQRGDASINGYAGVLLTVTKQPHTDTRALTDDITRALRELEPSLPADVILNAELFQMKGFIDLGVFNVTEALVIGATLVLVVLFLFLLNFRTTFISLTAIPLSLAVTALVFKGMGWLTGTVLSINVMTLGGIAVAMGELVDDAIVDVENIFRRLRENHHLPDPRPALRVIYEASVEVRSAIVFGTAMVILVFIPLFALSGIEGRLFAPLGVAYIVSILASLVVSLTVTPVLSYYLLPQARATHRERDSLLLRSLKWAAGYLVRFSMRHAALILLATWLLVGACVWLLTRLGTDFLPDFDEGSVQVNLSLPPGASLEESNRMTAIMDATFARMRKSPQNPEGEILNFSRRTGRAELDEHVEPVSNTHYILTMNPEARRPREEVIADLLEELEQLQLGGQIEVEQPLAHLISHMISGVTAQVAIKVYGDDLTELRAAAEEIKDAIGDVEGIAPPAVEGQQLVEELHVTPRPAALALYGVDREHLGGFVRTALYGEVVSEVIEGERRFDLLVRLDEPYRDDPETLARLLVLPEGKRRPLELGMLADIEDGLGPNTVNRENVRRRIVIRVNTLGRDLGSVVADIRQRVNERVRLPEGYFVEYGGQFESQRRATLVIGLLALVSLAGMFVLLYMLYPSVPVVLQILNALPTAFIGGVIALALTGQTLTVASMVGFISLGGIAARNGILLVSHYFHLMKYEGEGFTEGMVLRGSLERLSPVLMTALTAIIGLVPLVIAGLEPGREILYPVATVIVGGLITSTLCEFLVHPGLFWRFSGQDAVRVTEEMEGEEGAGPVTHPAVGLDHGLGQ